MPYISLENTFYFFDLLFYQIERFNLIEVQSFLITLLVSSGRVEDNDQNTENENNQNESNESSEKSESIKRMICLAQKLAILFFKLDREFLGSNQQLLLSSLEEENMKIEIGVLTLVVTFQNLAKSEMTGPLLERAKAIATKYPEEAKEVEKMQVN